jgi:hypothetical protein
MDLVKVIYGRWARQIAHRVLVGRLRVRDSAERGRFTRDDIDALLATAWESYSKDAPRLPRQPTAGSTMNVRLACFTLSFFHALQAQGVGREYAIELVADASWGIYSSWGRLASNVDRLRPGKRAALGFAVKAIAGSIGAVSLSFPFNAPGYRVQSVPMENGTGFDVVHCPIASYFRDHDAVDLCVASWCNLDYALGEMTHQKLVRTLTLVQGKSHCDFRIFPAQRAEAQVALPQNQPTPAA